MQLKLDSLKHKCNTETYEESRKKEMEHLEIKRERFSTQYLEEELKRVESKLEDRSEEAIVIKGRLALMESVLSGCMVISKAKLKDRDEVIQLLKTRNNNLDNVLMNCTAKLGNLLEGLDEEVCTLENRLEKAKKAARDDIVKAANDLEDGEEEICFLKDRLAQNVLEHEQRLEEAQNERQELVEEYSVVIEEYHIADARYKKLIEKVKSESRILQCTRENKASIEQQKQYILGRMQVLEQMELEIKQGKNDIDTKEHKEKIKEAPQMWELNETSNNRCGSLFRRFMIWLYFKRIICSRSRKHLSTSFDYESTSFNYDCSVPSIVTASIT